MRLPWPSSVPFHLEDLDGCSKLPCLQGSTDAARAASDVVLTESGLSTIVRAIIISRQIVQRMKNYLIYRIACTVQLLCFFFFSCLFISPSSYHQEKETGEAEWPAFFDLPVMSVVIITILNDGTIISIAYDRVRASRLPEVWNLRAISLVSMVIGVIAMASSMLLLHQCLRSNQINSVMHMFGVPFLSYGEIQVRSCERHCVSLFLGYLRFTTLYVAQPNPVQRADGHLPQNFSFQLPLRLRGTHNWVLLGAHPRHPDDSLRCWGFDH